MARKKLLDMTETEVLAELELKMPSYSRATKIIKLHPHNRDILKSLLAYNGAWLHYLDFKYHDDTELVTIAVSQNGSAIINASHRCCLDAKIVKLAVQSNANALAHVGQIFKDDLEYVRIATDQDVISVCYAGRVVTDNYSFMLELIQRSGRVYQYIGSTLTRNQELANIAVITYPSAVRHMNSDLFTFELIFNTLTCLEDRFFDIPKRLDFFGKTCTGNIYLMMEAARMYRKRNFGNTLLLYTNEVLNEFHPILDWVRTHDFPDRSWPYIRQALLLNPEPFLNETHVLQQVMNGSNDWGALAEYVLYEDALTSGNKHDATCDLADLNL